MRRIEAPNEIGEYINKYPNTRTTTLSLEQIQKRGIGYADCIAGSPIELKAEKYDFLTRQANAYLKVCERLCENYIKDPHFRTFIRALVLQFEDGQISSLVENYPLATLTGVIFGTDTMVTHDDRFKTTEVNLGPVGGPPEGAKAQSFFEAVDFPISGEFFLNHFVSSMDSYYQKACSAMRAGQKPLEERHVVYVENDLWFPGSFFFVDYMRKAGMNIDIAPREALFYDNKTNTLNLRSGDKTESVDQIILDFHLQDDLAQTEDKIPMDEHGHLVKALQNKAVVAETSLFPLIVLASKSMAGFISQVSNDPDGLLARRLNLNEEDLEIIKDMFPTTYHWRSKFFSRLDRGDSTRFDLLEYLSSNNFIIKSTRSNFFAGQGVFGLDDRKSRKGYEEFFHHLRQEVVNVLRSNKKGAILAKLVDNNFLDDFVKYAIRNNIFTKTEAHVNSDTIRGNLTGIFNILNHGINQEVQQRMNFSQEHVQRLAMIYEKIHNPTFSNETDVYKFLEDYAIVLAKSSHIDVAPEKINTLINGLISYLSTQMLLPYVIQEKIISSVQNELRTCGFVGDHATNNVSIVSTLKRPSDQEGVKSLHIFVPQKDIQKQEN